MTQINDPERNRIESKIVKIEGDFRELVLDYKIRRIGISRIKSFIENLVLKFPEAVPVVCNLARVEFSKVEGMDEYLDIQIINSYNVRAANNEPGAATLLENYLYSTGRKKMPVATMPSEDGEA